MWQLANTYYVYDEGVQRQPSSLLKSFVIIGTVSVMVFMSSLGAIQLNRVVSAVARLGLPGISLPSSPRLSPAAAASPAVSEAALTGVIKAWIKAHPEHQWSVGLQELGDGGSNVDVGDDTYQPVSLYKLLMLPAFFERFELSDLDTMIINGKPLRACFEKMLLESDNPCGEAIANNLVGWANIDSSLHAAGYSSLSLNNPQAMSINAKDTVAFMADFYEAKLTTPKVRDYVVSLLQRQLFRRGIPAGCPGCSVANKTGDNKVRHDVAVVKQGGKTYALGIFSDGGSYAEIAELTRLINQEMTKQP